MEFANVILVIFVIIRVVIAVGLVYLIYYEVKRVRKPKRGEDRSNGTKDRNHTNVTT